MVIIDHTGHFLAARSCLFMGLPLVKEEEVVCLLDAMRWAKGLHMEGIIFKTYVKCVVDSLWTKEINNIKFGSIITKC